MITKPAKWRLRNLRLRFCKNPVGKSTAEAVQMYLSPINFPRQPTNEKHRAILQSGVFSITPEISLHKSPNFWFLRYLS